DINHHKPKCQVIFTRPMEFHTRRKPCECGHCYRHTNHGTQASTQADYDTPEEVQARSERIKLDRLRYYQQQEENDRKAMESLSRELSKLHKARVASLVECYGSGHPILVRRLSLAEIERELEIIVSRKSLTAP
ncbi:hypothetical protein BGX30_008396, partial [Mortierella sp. GBA39]